MEDLNTTANGMTCDARNIINCSRSPDCASSLLYDTTTLAMVLVVMPTILAFGLVGNLTFLFVMARVRSMRTVTNAYLTNLAVADILFLVLSVGDKLIRYLVTPVSGDILHLGAAGCTVVYFLQHLFNWVSIILVSLVTMEKYYGVCHPLKHMILHTFSHTWKQIAGAWLLALVLSAAMVPAHCRVLHLCILWPNDDEYSPFPRLVGLCAGIPGQGWLATFSNLFQTIPFFFAMILSCFAYTRITCALKDRSKAIELSQEAILKNNHVRNQVSVMLITNGIAFFVCVAPFQLYCAVYAVRDLIGATVNFEVFVHVARIMLYLNSAVNPYIYSATNSRYRQSLRDAFMGRDTGLASTRRTQYSTNGGRKKNNGKSITQPLKQNSDRVSMQTIDRPINVSTQ